MFGHITMAKAKPSAEFAEAPKPVKRKSISVSGIFKSSRKHLTRNDNKHNLQPATSLPSHRGKPSARRNHTRAPDHPLAAAFNGLVLCSTRDPRANYVVEVLDNSENTINEQYTAVIRSTDQELQQRLRKSSQAFAVNLEAKARFNEVFYLPLADEGIDYSRRDGSQARHTTLGAQMKRFEKKVAAEEKELESLMKQWDQCQEELWALAVDVLGVDRATILTSESTDTLDNLVTVAATETAQSLQRDLKHFEELMESTGQQAVKRMTASEKVRAG